VKGGVSVNGKEKKKEEVNW